MQNNGNNCCRQGFVPLDGSWGSVNWNCGSCGCQNCGCDVCSNCGWNRCGCNQGCGAVVYTNGDARRNRSSNGCDDCQNSRNTRQSRERDNDCGCSEQTRSGDCGCSNAYYGSRSLYVECCDDNTSIREFSSDCDKCQSSRSSAQRRNTTCDKCGDNGETYTQNRSNGCDKCGNNGETYTQNRSNGCDKCGNNGETYAQNRSNGYDKYQDDSSAYNRSRKNKGVGMVWAAKQELDQIFESESALRSGTLFPELHKPMNGYCPGECNCQTDEQAAAFAAWELRLYLNTHPNDKKALALFRKLCQETCDPNYATSFLEEMDCDSGWEWTDDPWPWECRPCGK